MVSRVLNAILLIRRELAACEEFESFNDLLIIGRIVPKLPADCLCQMMLQLKPMLDLSQKTRSSSINLTAVYTILAHAPVEDRLLHDFLSSSGYGHCLTAWDYQTLVNKFKLSISEHTYQFNRKFWCFSALRLWVQSGFNSFNLWAHLTLLNGLHFGKSLFLKSSQVLHATHLFQMFFI